MGIYVYCVFIVILPFDKISKPPIPRKPMAFSGTCTYSRPIRATHFGARSRVLRLPSSSISPNFRRTWEIGPDQGKTHGGHTDESSVSPRH